AGQAGKQHRLRVDHADVPGAADEDALLGAGDEFGGRLGAAGQQDVARLADHAPALLLRPVARILQVLDDAVLHDVVRLARQSLLVPRHDFGARVPGIRADVHARVVDLLAQLGTATLLRQEA